MKLDDLKEMGIPHLAPIEVEYNLDCFPPEVRKCLGYFRSVEEEFPVRLTHYNFSDSPDRIPEIYDYERIDQIRSVTILLPK